jgi:putative ABC transport system permease protein
MVMQVLDRKLWRDLWQLKGQAAAITAVMASGVACFIMFLTTLDSLLLSRDLYYRDYRFAEVFAPLKRAPEAVRERIAAIPGVARVDSRVVALLSIDIEGFNEPVLGLVTSIPDRGEPLLNRLYLRAGRLPEAGREDEVVVSQDFAEAHGFQPGDRLHIILKGKRKQLRIVGSGGSPEYVHQLRPGGMFPDDKRYGLLWMARTPLANAYEMEGAFNQLVFALDRGAEPQSVLDRVDEILRPYGGTGAYLREDQPSYRFLAEELNQMDNLSGIFPIIFLGVAAFLLNVVVTRLVGAQREQIAALKAFGYTNPAIALHYLKLTLVIVLASILLGVALGSWLGQVLSEIYTRFFRLPFLIFELRPLRLVQVAGISLGAGLLGTLAAVRSAVRLRPAEAMRPEAPAGYRVSLLERLAGLSRLAMPSRMILRHVGHKPIKSLVTVLGIALASGILMTGRFQEDTVDFMMDVHFRLSQREDLTILFSEAISRRALTELRSLPGVVYGEAFRTVPVRLQFEHRSYRTSLHGWEAGAEIKQLVDRQLQPVGLPPAGILLNDYLGREILQMEVGDLLTVEVLEGSQPVRQVPVVAMVKQYLGTGAYMSLEELNRLMQEGHAISAACLYIEEDQADAIYRRLKEMPRVVGSMLREVEIENYHRTMDETMLFWTFVATLFSVIIAVGVVYNSARITLTERSRELASLRVLGYTRGEISYILLGELALLTGLAIPLGLWVGRELCAYIALNLQNDLYRVPLILEPHTYAFATLVVLITALVSGLLVRRRLDRLDLIEVLKTKE